MRRIPSLLIAAALAVPASSVAFAESGTVLRASAILGATFEQRRDVDEVSRPPPPSGPATPVPYCSPSAPICP
jgi:hypothetical protein